MKKRLWSILLVACMMLTLLPFGALAAEPEVVWSTAANDTVLYVSCDGNMPNYTAAKPAEWANLKTTVKTVIVEDGVTAIGNYAFNGFDKLESVSIAKSVSTIGEHAFAGCTGLKSVTIPDGVVTIGQSAFEGCSALETLTLAQTVTTISANAFKGCSALKDVYFGGTDAKWKIVTANMGTGNEALTKATKHVICEKHTTEVQNLVKPTCTEKGYTGDTVCKVCGTVISVGAEDPATGHAWKPWRPITDGQQRVCSNDSQHVETIMFPADTVLMPKTADILADNPESITVPNSRGNILWLKWVAEGMKDAKADTKNPYSDVAESALYYKAVLWALDEGILTAPAADAKDKTLAPAAALTAEQVCAIAGGSTLPIAGYEKDIPSTVTYKTTEKVWVIPSPTETSDANFVYVVSSDGKSVNIKSYKGDAEKVVIPEKVGDIPVVGILDGAFQGKAKMTDVTIPATVASIGADAFNGCSKLASVTIPDAVKVIGARAFNNCDALTSVVVPEGVTTVDKAAFANCDKLASAKLPKSLKTLAADTFANDPALKDIYFQSGEQDWIKLGDLYRNDSKVTVHYAEDASPLTWEVKDGKATVTGCLKTASGDLVIPATLDGAPVVAIAPGAFEDCNKLTSVSIPEGVTEIGFYTFNDCTSLKTVTLPKSLTKVDNYAFDGTSVKDVNYGGTLEDWANVVIKAGNDPLTKATVHPADCKEHKTELKDAKAATCTEKGFTGNEVCTVCGKTVKAGEEIAALGHDWGEWTVTKAPTATEKGEETRVCKRDATHTEKRDVDPSAPSENFVDVNNGDFFYDAVVWAVNAKPVVTTGTDALHFSPYDNCTRGQMVTFLYRAAGEPAVTNTTNPFTDVKADDFFYNAVLWAVQEKITTGTSATTFSPYDTVTRGQTVTFLWRYAKSPVVVTANPFTDVPAGEYYTNAVLWAVQEKITNGMTATTFEPNTPCTRGQIVTFLYRDLGQSK